MADLTVQKIGGDTPALGLNQASAAVSKLTGLKTAGSGSVAPVAAAAGGDAFLNDGRTFLEIVNGVTATTDVNFARQRPDSAGQKYNLTVSVPVSTTMVVGPFPAGDYNDNNNKCQITYSQVVNLTVRAFKLSERATA